MKNLNAESLSLLLARFSEDEQKAAAEYTNLRGALIRFFELKGDSEPYAAADETLDRAALKIAAQTPIDDLKKYSFGVARLVYLERLRRVQKEKNAETEFYTGKTVVPFENESDNSNFFRECFQKLPGIDRDLLQRYFADLPYEKLVDSRRLLIAEKKVSMEQMRVKIFRLRKRLDDCVRLRRENS